MTLQAKASPRADGPTTDEPLQAGQDLAGQSPLSARIQGWDRGGGGGGWWVVVGVSSDQRMCVLCQLSLRQVGRGDEARGS